MKYNLDFLLITLIFLFILLYHFAKRKRLEDIRSRIFRAFILLGIADISFDIITTLLIAAQNPDLVPFTRITLTVFYLLQAMIPFSILWYARSLMEPITRSDSVKTLLLSIPCYLVLLGVILNCWNGLIFSVNSDGVYIHGPYYLSMYYYAIIYSCVVLLSSCVNYKKLGNKKFVTICKFLLIMAICVMIQALRPELLTTGAGLGLGITVLYLTVNNPSNDTDWLTEDFNMKSFVEYLRELYHRRKKFHVITFDIQNLTQLNMLFGIRFVDTFLCEISVKLHEILGTSYVFRITNKRFLLLTFSLSEYERVRDTLHELLNRPFTLDGETIIPTGIICGVRYADALQDSDTLLSYINYLTSLSPDSSELLLIQNDSTTMKNFQYSKEIERFLRTAIEEDLFEVYYQPVFSLEKGCYVSAEALSRLRHPSFGPIPPDVFITIAERTKQIAQIGLLQFRRVCSFVKEHPFLLEQLDHINFNLSPAELLRDGYSQKILDIIQEFGLPFSFFQIEITETVATEYTDSLYRLTKDFEEYGIRLNLDDFGSGYANLNTVLRLPFSCIKLDRSLLYQITENKNTELFYRNIVRTLDGMGYAIIAEGIETDAELALIREMGVELIQGYYFSKPLPPEQFLTLLQK